MAVWYRLQDVYPKLMTVVATADPPNEIQEVLAANKSSKLRILRDPLNRGGRAFNSLWLPRAYALDERGRIAYVQPHTVRDAVAAFEIGELWQGR